MYNPYGPPVPMTDTEQENSYAFSTISRPYKVVNAYASNVKYPTPEEKKAINIKYPKLSSGETVKAGTNAKNDPSTPFLGLFDKDPNSNCPHCIQWDWECEARKVVCEAAAYDLLPWILGGFGVLVVVILATK